jgi:hypothetical protein
MSKLAFVVAMGAAGGAIAGCVSQQLQQQVQGGEVINSDRWVATLASQGSVAGQDGASGAQVSGSATLNPTDNGFAKATVAILHGAPGATLAWQVHIGHCGADFGVLGQPTAYPAITIAPDGRGSAEATIDSGAPSSGPLYVVVRDMGDENHRVVACGELQQRAGAR